MGVEEGGESSDRRGFIKSGFRKHSIRGRVFYFGALGVIKEWGAIIS
jgi:hypothetical protein